MPLLCQCDDADMTMTTALMLPATHELTMPLTDALTTPVLRTEVIMEHHSGYSVKSMHQQCQHSGQSIRSRDQHRSSPDHGQEQSSHSGSARHGDYDMS